MLALSLDIANLQLPLVACSLFSSGIQKSPGIFQMDYLFDRSLCYVDRDNSLIWASMTCGVLQDSVLGLILWNIWYYSVLRFEAVSGLLHMCYTDTLIMMTGFVREDSGSCGAGDSCSDFIENLNLRVLFCKTKMVTFMVDKISVTILWVEERRLKYLGLVLGFEVNFSRRITFFFLSRVSPSSRIWRMAVGRFSANIGEPGEGTLWLLCQWSCMRRRFEFKSWPGIGACVVWWSDFSGYCLK